MPGIIQPFGCASVASWSTAAVAEARSWHDVAATFANPLDLSGVRYAVSIGPGRDHYGIFANPSRWWGWGNLAHFYAPVHGSAGTE